MKNQLWITKELAVRVNKILCNKYGLDCNVRNKKALDKVFNEVKTLYTKEHSNPIEMLTCITLGLINEHPFENCNKRTSLVLFNYYLEKHCGFTLSDSDKYKYANKFKKLNKNGKFNDEFRRWVQEYINLRILAKVNNADFIYS